MKVRSLAGRASDDHLDVVHISKRAGPHEEGRLSGALAAFNDHLGAVLVPDDPVIRRLQTAIGRDTTGRWPREGGHHRVKKPRCVSADFTIERDIRETGSARRSIR